MSPGLLQARSGLRPGNRSAGIDTSLGSRSTEESGTGLASVDLDVNLTHVVSAVVHDVKGARCSLEVGSDALNLDAEELAVGKNHVLGHLTTSFDLERGNHCSAGTNSASRRGGLIAANVERATRLDRAIGILLRSVVEMQRESAGFRVDLQNAGCFPVSTFDLQVGAGGGGHGSLCVVGCGLHR